MFGACSDATAPKETRSQDYTGATYRKMNDRFCPSQKPHTDFDMITRRNRRAVYVYRLSFGGVLLRPRVCARPTFDRPSVFHVWCSRIRRELDSFRVFNRLAITFGRRVCIDDLKNVCPTVFSTQLLPRLLHTGGPSKSVPIKR